MQSCAMLSWMVGTIIVDQLGHASTSATRIYIRQDRGQDD